tara:strand:- start:4012 stop:5241 length:1230 start_codon:yes stop_codon:yes gene_type:complete
MSSDKKIILFEGEMIGGKGHHYHQLVENSFYYKDRGQIYWIVSKNFDSKDLYIPDFVNVKKCINSAKRNLNIKSSNNFFLTIKNILSNFFLIMYLLLKFNKISFEILFNLLNIPKYFSSFYLNFDNKFFDENDVIIFQTSRIDDFELGHFLSKLNYKCKMHFRIMQLNRKKRLKKFINIINDLYSSKKLFKDIFVYTENYFQKEKIKDLTNLDFEIFYNNLTFSEKNYGKNIFCVGFVGESRIDKGFDKIPKIVEQLNLDTSIKKNFFIQISNCPKNLNYVKNEIYYLKKKFNNIKILEGYINYFEYKKLLENIDIMPILHTPEQLKFNGSGLVFSAITNEIPLVIPKYANYVHKILTNKSFKEAENINEYVLGIKFIIKNYDSYLLKSKAESMEFKNKLLKDPLNNRI